jgi:hypothetical protein
MSRLFGKDTFTLQLRLCHSTGSIAIGTFLP